jgi:hypothetical protein
MLWSLIACVPCDDTPRGARAALLSEGDAHTEEVAPLTRRAVPSQDGVLTQGPDGVVLGATVVQPLGRVGEDLGFFQDAPAFLQQGADGQLVLHAPVDAAAQILTTEPTERAVLAAGDRVLRWGDSGLWLHSVQDGAWTQSALQSQPADWPWLVATTTAPLAVATWSGADFTVLAEDDTGALVQRAQVDAEQVWSLTWGGAGHLWARLGTPDPDVAVVADLDSGCQVTVPEVVPPVALRPMDAGVEVLGFDAQGTVWVHRIQADCILGMGVEQESPEGTFLGATTSRDGDPAVVVGEWDANSTDLAYISESDCP